MILNLTGRKVQVAPVLLRIRVIRTRVQKGRTERRALLVPIKRPDNIPHRVKYVHSVATLTEECIPPELTRVIDYWLELHTQLLYK